jgi:sugar lactone lactonase YvrE
MNTIFVLIFLLHNLSFPNLLLNRILLSCGYEITWHNSHSNLFVESQSTFDNVLMKLVAGTSTSGYSGDGDPATSAQIRSFISWVDNNGNIFLPDDTNRRIRKVSPTGIISTFGGTGSSSLAGVSGPIGSVNFWTPYSIVGNVGGTILYICDVRYVWKYEFSTGIAAPFAHSISLGAGFGGDDGAASSAQLSSPLGIWLTTAGVLYIADTDNQRIRKVSTEGIITTVAGSGPTGQNTGTYSGDNGLATAAKLRNPTSVYMDTNGNLFIADRDNGRIRKVAANNIITTFAGSGTLTPFNGENVPRLTANINLPADVKGDSLGNIYIADGGNCLVRIVDTQELIWTLFGLGIGSCGFTSAEVSPRGSKINSPNGIWLDSVSNIYFSDYNSIHRGVFLSPTSQPSGQPSRQPTNAPAALSPRSFNNVFMQLLAGKSTTGTSGDSGPATSAQIIATHLWVDFYGNFYIAGWDSYRIRKVTPAGIISMFGGTGTQSTAGMSGPISSVSFYTIWAIVGDAADTFLYICDQRYVWKYVFSTNIASVFAQSTSLGPGFSGDNSLASLSQLNHPLGIWVTSFDDLFIADQENHRIRKVSLGIITTVAGSGGVGSFSGDNGPATSATLNWPRSMYVDTSGKLFIADERNNRIRVVNSDNIITTFAGSGTQSPFNGDNIPALSANIGLPLDVKGDSLGNMFVADYTNAVIRMINVQGIISTLFGTPGSTGFSVGISSKSSSINAPHGIVLDTLSNIYFADFNSIHRSVDLSPSSQPTSQPTDMPTSQPTDIPTLHSITYTHSFTFNGAFQSLVVPPEATQMFVELAGAGGLGNGGCGWAGNGALLQATLSVIPGTVIYIYVGGNNGWNGGGPGGGTAANFFGGNGGGATDIRIGGQALSNRKIVAGGGGGATYQTVNSCGLGFSNGGFSGLAGENGGVWGPFGAGGTVGNPGFGGSSTGGSRGTGNCGGTATDGSLGQGGNGDGAPSGGGGGGYYGG